MELNPIVVWCLIGLALAFMEFIVPGVFLVFFAVGAWITALTTHFAVTDVLLSQIIVFTGSSVLMLFGLREWVQGKLYGHVTHRQDLNENLNEFEGQRVTVKKDIGPGRCEGAVEYKGAVWTVISEDHFAQGETATVVGTEGIALKISKSLEA